MLFLTHTSLLVSSSIFLRIFVGFFGWFYSSYLMFVRIFCQPFLQASRIEFEYKCRFCGFYVLTTQAFFRSKEPKYWKYRILCNMIPFFFHLTSSWIWLWKKKVLAVHVYKNLWSFVVEPSVLVTALILFPLAKSLSMCTIYCFLMLAHNIQVACRTCHAVATTARRQSFQRRSTVFWVGFLQELVSKLPFDTENLRTVFQLSTISTYPDSSFTGEQIAIVQSNRYFNILLKSHK